MGLNLSPPEDFLNLVTNKSDLNWKMKIGFEMTYSGLLKLASTPVLIVEKIPEDVPENPASIPPQQNQDQKAAQFSVTYRSTNFVDTFSPSDSDRILNRYLRCIPFSRLNEIQNLQILHQERSLNRNRLESAVYKVERGDSDHLEPYISPENLLERGRLIDLSKTLLNSPENNPDLNQEIIDTYELLTELESKAKNLKQSRDSFNECAADFLEYSKKLIEEHHSEDTKNQKANSLIAMVQQKVTEESSHHLYEPTENSCSKISTLKLELDAIYANAPHEGTPKEDDSHREL